MLRNIERVLDGPLGRAYRHSDNVPVLFGRLPVEQRVVCDIEVCSFLNCLLVRRVRVRVVFSERDRREFHNLVLVAGSYVLDDEPVLKDTLDDVDISLVQALDLVYAALVLQDAVGADLSFCPLGRRCERVLRYCDDAAVEAYPAPCLHAGYLALEAVRQFVVLFEIDRETPVKLRLRDLVLLPVVDREEGFLKALPCSSPGPLYLAVRLFFIWHHLWEGDIERLNGAL